MGFNQVKKKEKERKKRKRKENNGTSALEALCRIDAAFYSVIYNKQVTVSTCSDPVVQFEQKKKTGNREHSETFFCLDQNAVTSAPGHITKLGFPPSTMKNTENVERRG